MAVMCVGDTVKRGEDAQVLARRKIRVHAGLVADVADGLACARALREGLVAQEDLAARGPNQRRQNAQ
jgi:hypothetical protein